MDNAYPRGSYSKTHSKRIKTMSDIVTEENITIRHIVWAVAFVLCVFILSIMYSGVRKNQLVMENGYTFDTLKGANQIVIRAPERPLEPYDYAGDLPEDR
jgi:hypothetical protein